MLKERIRPEQESGWAVDKGQRRDLNEDSVAAASLTLVDGDMDKTVGIYAVADGVGGESFGEVASSMAVRTYIEEITQRITGAAEIHENDYETWSREAVHAANQMIYEDQREMATTLVGMMLIDNRAYITNVGDSRAYLLTDQGMYQITEDHSLVQALFNAGAIDKDEVANHPYKNVLNQAVGFDEQTGPDFYITDVRENEYLLLCSDGLTNELDDESICSIIREAESPQVACNQLVEQANRNGGRDNISVLIVSV